MMEDQTGEKQESVPHFKIRNFEQFQHYNRRNPPWIKLYFRLLHDRRFFRLDNSTKFQVIGLFLLASQHKNNLPMDSEWIEKELSSDVPMNWQAIIDSEFIVPIDCDASALSATCGKIALRDRDRDRYTETETETEILSFSQKDSKRSASEASAIFKLWNLQPGVMHHRSILGSEKAIHRTLSRYSPDEIRLAIERYSMVRANADGRYRDVYQWTLSEFLTRQEFYNIERFTAENWETPFLAPATPQAKSKLTNIASMFAGWTDDGPKKAS